MRNVERIIPAAPTLSMRDLLRASSVAWQKWFPFSHPSGCWSFSGRVSLYHGLPLLELPAGSTILVPNYFQGVEVETLLAAGHRLRFYRITRELRADLEDIERRAGRDVSALYVIHYFGFPQPLPSLKELCRAHGWKLIEDCALALFSRSCGSWAGETGDIAIFSVYKSLPLPHGGFLVSRRDRPSQRLASPPRSSTLMQLSDLVHRNLRLRGRGKLQKEVARLSRGARRLLGWNRGEAIASGESHWDPRLLGYGASRWVPRLMGASDPARVVERRRSNYQRLSTRLRGRVSCPFPELPEEGCPHFFPVLVPDKPLFERELRARGIETVNLWAESHPACPAELEREVSHFRNHLHELPIHQDLDADDVDRLADEVSRIL